MDATTLPREFRNVIAPLGGGQEPLKSPPPRRPKGQKHGNFQSFDKTVRVDVKARPSSTSGSTPHADKVLQIRVQVRPHMQTAGFARRSCVDAAPHQLPGAAALPPPAAPTAKRGAWLDGVWIGSRDDSDGR